MCVRGLLRAPPVDRAAARWCAGARSLAALAPAARRPCCPLPPARHRDRRRAAAARLLPLAPDFDFGSAGGGAAAAAACGVLLVDLLLAGALVEILRHALLEARHAFGEHRLAIARQFFLGVEEVEHDRWDRNCMPPAAAGQRARQARRRRRAIRRFDPRMVNVSLNSFSVSSSRPAAATPAALRRASAGPAASRRHWRSDPATAASPWRRWRARPTAPAIRARYGGRSRPAPSPASSRCSMLG